MRHTQNPLSQIPTRTSVFRQAKFLITKKTSPFSTLRWFKIYKSSFSSFWCISFLIPFFIYCINHIYLKLKLSLSLPCMFFIPISFIPSSESLSLLSHCNTATFLSNIFFCGKKKSFSICSSFETLVLSIVIKDKPWIFSPYSTVQLLSLLSQCCLQLY